MSGSDTGAHVRAAYAGGWEINAKKTDHAESSMIYYVSERNAELGLLVAGWMRNHQIPKCRGASKKCVVNRAIRQYKVDTLKQK